METVPVHPSQILSFKPTFASSDKLVGLLHAHLEEQDQWLASCVSGPWAALCSLCCKSPSSLVDFDLPWASFLGPASLHLVFPAVTTVQCDLYTEQLSFLGHLSLSLSWSVFPGSPPWKGNVKDEGILCNVEACREAVCGPGHAAVP